MTLACTCAWTTRPWQRGRPAAGLWRRSSCRTMTAPIVCSTSLDTVGRATKVGTHPQVARTQTLRRTLDVFHPAPGRHEASNRGRPVAMPCLFDELSVRPVKPRHFITTRQFQDPSVRPACNASGQRGEPRPRHRRDTAPGARAEPVTPRFYPLGWSGHPIEEQGKLRMHSQAPAPPK